jgi:UDP-N-acetylmuramoyl-tripeptide--D-alanyl-D-alanine ligase
LDELFFINEVASILGCNIKKDGGFSSVCIDSRVAKKGSLFVALAGERTDGHKFVDKAFENGAVAAIVERDHGVVSQNGVLFVVENSLKALQKLARSYLDKFPSLLRIGITGSSGKTTVKEIFASMAAFEKKVVCNSGNLNSESGLPLSVFSVRDCHEIACFEAGMNRVGEIGELTEVLRPQIALITNVGSAHIGRIGSKDGIAAEKKAIFSLFTGSQTAIINEDDEYSSFLSEGVKGKVRFFGEKTEESKKRLKIVKNLDLLGWDIEWEGEALRFALPGAHNLKNAFAAIAIADAAGLSARSIAAGLSAAKSLFGRSEVLQGRFTILRDCYNANPQSLREAVFLCDSVSQVKKRFYVIGSMLELGDKSDAAHREAGELLSVSNADEVFLFGEEIRCALDILKNKKKVFHTNDIEELKTLLKNAVKDGDLVLLKGSRGCALERVFEGEV